jgi:hypothetical protein
VGLPSEPRQHHTPQEKRARSVWRWNFGIGMVFVGAVLTYSIQFHDWKLAQLASILGVALIVAGIVLLTINLGRDLPDERSLESANWLIRLVWVAAFGLGVIILYAIQYQHWALQRVASTASIGLITAGAAWLSGALLGFIFGLPHTREGASVPTQGAGDRQTQASNGAPLPDRRRDDRYQRSTSLEQVSDWLTKMIVGVGLTQLNRIPGKLYELATYIANGLIANGAGGGYSDVHGLDVNRAFALGICIYFVVDGFLFGFLWACLDLLELFRRLDSPDLEQTKSMAKKAEQQAEKAIQKAATGPDTTYEIIKARDLYKAIEEKRKKKQAVDANDINLAEEFIKKLSESSVVFPTNRALHVVLANLYYETGKWDSAVAVLRGFIAAREKAGQTDDDDVATAWFNLACFYSTRSEKEGEGTRASELLKEAESDLVQCLEAARRSGPTTLALHLKRANDDDDLAPLRRSGVLAAILKRYET